jgi:hypothetical protein
MQEATMQLRPDLDCELTKLTERFESDIRQDERFEVLADVIRFLCVQCREGVFASSGSHGMPVHGVTVCSASSVWVNVIGHMLPIQERLKKKINDALKLGMVVNKNLKIALDDLELSVRVSQCLKSAGCRTLGDITQLSEMDLLKTKNFGRKSLRELKELLGDYSMALSQKSRGAK